MFWDGRKHREEVKNVSFSEEQISINLMVQFMRHRYVYTRFVNWMDIDWVHKLRYEDFITHKEQTIKDLAKIIHHPFDQMVAEMNSKRGPTFRKGIIGDYKNYFKDFHNKIFKQEFGNIMDRLGYDL
jgi:hypothetical protein